ncbi:NHL repeat-containing protein [Stachybotrys elegans]|uniref:NHL repeat-containing protein n=1 Tax=Stachybotrys elegans TaxID=80388 RepID=A0A8K0T6B9_9HYPO|nr:NHL repeat-containing protein [Stachybotrys elegans]
MTIPYLRRTLNSSSHLTRQLLNKTIVNNYRLLCITICRYITLARFLAFRMLRSLTAGLLCAAALRPVIAACEERQPAADIQAAPGVGFKLLKNDLRRPRQVIVDSQDNLLVLAQGAGEVWRFVLDDQEGLDVCIDSLSVILSNPDLTHSLALSADGQTLFASSSEDVYVYPYDPETGITGDPTVIITGMSDYGDHPTRTILVPKQNPDLLIVAQGSKANLDEDAINIDSGIGQLRSFVIDELLSSSSPATYTNGAVLGWGLRNVVGMTQDPLTGAIWSVDNAMDNFQRAGIDVHFNNPGEELNFHGRPDGLDSTVFGQNFGYPDCVAIWDPSAIVDYAGTPETGKRMVGNQSRSLVSDLACQTDYIPPRLTFGAHMAPLDIAFQEDGSAAFITFHGSWNRDTPVGYRLSLVRFSDGEPVAPGTSMDAEEPLLWNANIEQCPFDCFRPVSVTLDSSGRLFMTSDSTGELFVITLDEA